MTVPNLQSLMKMSEYRLSRGRSSKKRSYFEDFERPDLSKYEMGDCHLCGNVFCVRPRQSRKKPPLCLSCGADPGEVALDR